MEPTLKLQGFSVVFDERLFYGVGGGGNTSLFSTSYLPPCSMILTLHYSLQDNDRKIKDDLALVSMSSYLYIARPLFFPIFFLMTEGSVNRTKKCTVVVNNV